MPSATAVSSSLSTSCWNGIVPSGGLIAQHQSAACSSFRTSPADFGSFVGNTRIVLPKTSMVGRQKYTRIGPCGLHDSMYFITAVVEVKSLRSYESVRPRRNVPFGFSPKHPIPPTRAFRLRLQSLPPRQFRSWSILNIPAQWFWGTISPL